MSERPAWVVNSAMWPGWHQNTVVYRDVPSSGSKKGGGVGRGVPGAPEPRNSCCGAWSPMICDAWSPGYLITVKPGAPNEMLWSPGAPIFLSWSPEASHILGRSPGALNPFGTMLHTFLTLTVFALRLCSPLFNDTRRIITDCITYWAHAYMYVSGTELSLAIFSSRPPIRGTKRLVSGKYLFGRR